MMKVLTVGGGGREHAIVEAFHRAGSEIFAVMKNANPGIIARSSKYKLVDETKVDEVCAFAKECGVELAFVGPEAPLGAGLADALAKEGIKVASPTKDAARIETSKTFMRDLVAKYKIPGNVVYKSFDSAADAKAYLKTIGMNYVVKPVGLTGGKGVKVMGEHMKCTEDAEKYIDEIFSGNIGGAGVIIEEKLEGEEFTQMVFCDGKKISPMPLVQDHKRAYEGDMGPNTGGMGSYSMADHLLPFITAEERQKSLDIIQAVIDALAKEGCPYKGVLYGQFMLTVDGPKIIEFNARFGDPEAMNVLSILDSNFEKVCLQIADGNLKEDVKFAPKATVCKYAVPKGYGTSNVESGREISFDLENFAKSKAILYYANINMVGDEMITGTSRSAGVVGVSNSTDEAEWNCEVGLSCINCDYIAVRHDIGKASLIRKRVDHMARLRGQ